MTDVFLARPLPAPNSTTQKNKDTHKVHALTKKAKNPTNKKLQNASEAYKLLHVYSAAAAST
jgi:hypothetical protein